MQATMDSPLGKILLTEEAGALVRLEFVEQALHISPESRLLLQACIELEEYFSGKRKEFSLPLAPAGTAFQKRVWQALKEIPYGERRTYGQLAREIGSPGACRAAGSANGKNPLPILIPCHRVVAAGGKLGGYSLGLWRKEWLLMHENTEKG